MTKKLLGKLLGMMFCFILIQATCQAAEKQWVNGKVTHVVDGDTVDIKTTGGTKWRIRFYGIDTPEHKYKHWEEQPYAKESHKFTKNMIFGKSVTVRFKMKLINGKLEIDRTGNRVVGEIFYDGKSVNRELIQSGCAWWNKKYAQNDLDLRELQKGAKGKKKGLWANSDAVPPWIWRQKDE